MILNEVCLVSTFIVQLGFSSATEIYVSSAKCLRNALRRLQRKQNSRTCYFFLFFCDLFYFFIVIFASKTSRAAHQQVSLMQLCAHGAVYTGYVIVKRSQFLSPLFKWRKANVRAENAEANEHQIKLLFCLPFINSSRKTAYRITKLCNRRATTAALHYSHAITRQVGTSFARIIENWHNSTEVCVQLEFVVEKWLNRSLRCVAVNSLECDSNGQSGFAIAHQLSRARPSLFRAEIVNIFYSTNNEARNFYIC